MANATKLEQYGVYRLTDSNGLPLTTVGNISSTSTTTIELSSAAKNELGAVLTGNIVFGIRTKEGKTEMVYFPAGSSTDGITWTGATRGVVPSGYAVDGTEPTGSATYAIDIIPEGSIVECVIAPQQLIMILKAIDGTIATGGNNLRVGDLTDADITFYAQNADTNKPFIQYDASANQWIFSNDGVSTTDVGGGTGTITAGDGIDITVGEVALDIKADRGLVITSTELDVKLKTSGGVTVDTDGFSVVQSELTDFVREDDYTAKGDELVASAASTPAVLAVGTNGQFRVADSAETTGQKWTTIKELGLDYNKTYYTYPLSLAATCWDSTGSPTTVDAGSYIKGTSALTTAFYLASSLIGSGADINAQWDDGKTYICEFRLIGSAFSNDAGWGFGKDSFLSPYNATGNNKVAFSYDYSETKLYATTANGAATTTTEITGITITNFNTYRIEFDQGTDAKFYVNGVLKATITTNLPNSAAEMTFGFGISSTSGNDSLTMGAPLISYEL